MQLASIHRRDDIAPFYTSTTNGDFIYADPSSDEALLHSVSPHMITLQELCVSNVQTMKSAQRVSSSTTFDIPSRQTFVSDKRHKAISAESIAELWGIGPKRAQATIDATTQRGTRSAVLLLVDIEQTTCTMLNNSTANYPAILYGLTYDHYYRIIAHRFTPTNVVLLSLTHYNAQMVML